MIENKTIFANISFKNSFISLPFCPCREANLSPICGIRTERTRILTNLLASELRVIMTWSTIPVSLFRRKVEASLFEYLWVRPSKSSSFSGKVMVLPKKLDCEAFQLKIVKTYQERDYFCCKLTNDYIISRYTNSRCNNSVVIQFIINDMLHS